MSIEGDRSKAGMFSPGEILSATKLNDLANLAGYGKQWHSGSNLVAQGSFGTVDLSGPQDAQQSQIYDFPFKVTVTGGTGNEKKVKVRPGTVNNFVPKIGSLYLDGPVTPVLTFSSVGSSGKKIVALKVTKSGYTFFPNTVEVVLLDDTGVNTDNDGYLSLASITCSTTGGILSVTAVSQFVYASQMVARVKPTGATAVWSFTSR